MNKMIFLCAAILLFICSALIHAADPESSPSAIQPYSPDADASYMAPPPDNPEAPPAYNQDWRRDFLTYSDISYGSDEPPSPTTTRNVSFPPDIEAAPINHEAGICPDVSTVQCYAKMLCASCCGIITMLAAAGVVTLATNA